jgi:hypothetical protein
MKKYGNTIVNCKRIVYNPCASDEYEVTIKPYGEREQVIYTLVGPFERDEDVCDRIYRKWLYDNSK